MPPKLNERRHGMELPVVRELEKRFPENDIFVIKYARGGSNLHRQWDPENTHPDKGFYAIWLESYREGMAQLRERYPEVRVMGLYWDQGESDGKKAADEYEANLTHFIDVVRRDTGIPELTFFIRKAHLPLAQYRHDHRRPIRDRLEGPELPPHRHRPRDFRKELRGLGLQPRKRPCQQQGIRRADKTIVRGPVKRGHGRVVCLLYHSGKGRPPMSPVARCLADRPSRQPLRERFLTHIQDFQAMKHTFTLLAFLLFAPLIASPAADQSEQKPNIVFILVDDLGYADLGCQGSDDIRTPRIDSLAGQGIRFTDAYVTAPQCGPSRAGIVTGLNQARFGYLDNKGHSGLPDPDVCP